MSDVLKPRRAGVGEGEAPALAQARYEDESFAKKYPVLAEFLQREWWEPGKPRMRGSLILFCEEGLFKACISDKDGEFVAFLSKKGFAGLLEALEKGLREDSLDWRLTAAGKQRKRK